MASDDPAACRIWLDRLEGEGAPPEVVATLRRLVDEEANPWIAVGDRLPPRTGQVLFFDGRVTLGDYWRHLGEWADGQGDESTPTHWMPLPDPPPNEDPAR